MRLSRRRWFAVSIGIATMLAVGAVQGADVVGPDTVRVGGNVARPGAFTLADLTAMASREVVLDAAGSTPRRYRGVPLRDLLTACGPVQTGRFDLRHCIVVARAADGYLAVFSWTELFDSAIGDDALVVVGLDGAALTGAEGPIALVSGADRHGGPRHVRWLATIDVRRVAP